MTREAREWTKLTRVSGGGVHAYIPGEIVNRALDGAGIDKAANDLEVKFYANRSNWTGRASILLRVRVRTGGEDAKQK